MCCRCTLTVPLDISSCSAISLFDSPSAARSITSRSRADNKLNILRTPSWWPGGANNYLGAFSERDLDLHQVRLLAAARRIRFSLGRGLAPFAWLGLGPAWSVSPNRVRPF